MPMFLDPTGHRNFGIGICDRCRMKRYLDQLVRDPNYPGLRVCDPGQVRDGCKDQFDPWRLAPRQTENIVLPFNRPDVFIADKTGDITVDSFGNISNAKYSLLANYLTTEGGIAITLEGGGILVEEQP